MGQQDGSPGIGRIGQYESKPLLRNSEYGGVVDVTSCVSRVLGRHRMMELEPCIFIQ